MTTTETVKHTPGPWIIRSKETIGRMNIQVGTEDNWFVAKCESFEDARLIAAAPELLQALRHAHNSLRTFRNVPKDEQEWTPTDDDTMTAIETAITKAEQE